MSTINISPDYTYTGPYIEAAQELNSSWESSASDVYFLVHSYVGPNNTSAFETTSLRLGRHYMKDCGFETSSFTVSSAEVKISNVVAWLEGIPILGTALALLMLIPNQMELNRCRSDLKGRLQKDLDSLPVGQEQFNEMQALSKDLLAWNNALYRRNASAMSIVPFLKPIVRIAQKIFTGRTHLGELEKQYPNLTSVLKATHSKLS